MHVNKPMYALTGGWSSTKELLYGYQNDSS